MPASPASWLIVEPTLTGHHYAYLERLVDGATRRRLRVVVGVGTDAAGGEIERRLRAAQPGAQLEFVRTPLPAALDGPGRLARGMLRWRRFYAETWRAASAANRIDFVLVPYLDYALFAIALLGSPFGGCPFAGITMRQRFHFAEMGVHAASRPDAGWRRRLFRRLLSLPTLARVFVIDETLLEYFAEREPELARKLTYVPDPSDPPCPRERASARAALGLPDEARVVLLYGYIEARKGVATLLDWAAGADPGCALHVVLAGRIDRDARGAVGGAPAARLRAAGRLHVLDRYVTPDEEQTLFSAADWVWLAYRDFELMSGVLVKAAQHGRGVLYRDVGLIGRFARRHGVPAQPGATAGGERLHLPTGVELCEFGRDAGPVIPMVDHSWEHAWRIVFDGETA